MAIGLAHYLTVAAILFTIPMLFYIVGVLRHPLVGGTTRHPASLLEVPPEALRGLSGASGK